VIGKIVLTMLVAAAKINKSSIVPWDIVATFEVLQCDSGLHHEVGYIWC
jgi:hypothetical protein